MRTTRVVALGVTLTVLLVSSGMAATQYVITSSSQISPSVRETLQDSGYYKVMDNAPRPLSASVSLRVPAGNYLVSGGCTAARSDPPGTPLTFSDAEAVIYTGGKLPQAGAETSVPNQGNPPFPQGHDIPEDGYASLSDSTGLTLPRGGSITQMCEGSSGTYLSLLHVTAVRVGSLRGETVGSASPTP